LATGQDTRKGGLMRRHRRMVSDSATKWENLFKML
jgi:hypothetical protein